jgi:hypothetical protein
MALEPTPDTLLRLQTEVNIANAQLADLQGKAQQRLLVDVTKLELATVTRAHRIREQMLTSPGRHTALIAAKEGVDPAQLNVALMRFVRETLHAIAAGPAKH